MKINWSDLGVVALVVFIFWPWMVGIVDIVAWISVGHTVSFIPWQSNRGGAAAVWPFAWIILFIMFAVR